MRHFSPLMTEKIARAQLTIDNGRHWNGSARWKDTLGQSCPIQAQASYLSEERHGSDQSLKRAQRVQNGIVEAKEIALELALGRLWTLEEKKRLTAIFPFLQSVCVFNHDHILVRAIDAKDVNLGALGELLYRSPLRIRLVDALKGHSVNAGSPLSSNVFDSAHLWSDFTHVDDAIDEVLC